MRNSSSGAGRGRKAARKRAPPVPRNGAAHVPERNGVAKGSPAGNDHARHGAARNGHARNGHAPAEKRKVGRVMRFPPEPTAPPEPPPVPIEVRVAKSADLRFVPRITALLEEAQRGGAIIAIRPTDYLEGAIRERRAVVAVQGATLVGFAAAHAWEEGKFVSHSALVVAPEFRGRRLARRIKRMLLDLTHKRWPDAAVMSLTLSYHVERMNQQLGFETVPYCDLTKDPEFWKGCDGCVHQPHLKRNQQQDCHCWAGLLMPIGRKVAKVIPRDAHGHPSACSGDY